MAEDHLAHRRLLDRAATLRPFDGTEVFERIGGRATVDELVDLLYDGIEADPRLRPLFPRDPRAGRAMQKLFFAEWLGGPALYSEQAHSGLAHRHDDVEITRERADRWLRHFEHALRAAVTDSPERAAIARAARLVALELVNRPEWAQDKQIAWCGAGARPVTRATGQARRGDAAGLEAMLEQHPELLRPRFAAAIMQAAAFAGRTHIIALLLNRGVGPDHPFYLPVRISGPAYERVLFATPLCAARMKRRTAAEAQLVSAGAHEDVFTAAYLGEDAALEGMLVADPEPALTSDPAVDVLRITPIDHAAAGDRLSALRLLLDRTGDLPYGGVRALRAAAAHGDAAMVRLLLDHGADASRIGAGRWVLDPELADLLARHGARVDPTGSWIGLCCTGNQGRKDDPDYVRALLRHGARATDRRGAGTEDSGGVAGLQATALHHAAKAGFVGTVAVLLEHGADPHARDNRGRTPLDWLQDAAPSVSRAAVRDALSSGSHKMQANEHAQ